MYEMTQRVKYSELDRFGRLSMPALLNLYQDVATMQTDDVGFPLDTLMKERQGWFVVAYHIRNYRLPRHGEHIVIKTFPIKVKGFMGFRLFELATPEGEVLNEAYSEWVHMDLSKMSPSRVPAEMAEAYNVDVEKSSDKWTDSRKIPVPESSEPAGSFLVDGVYLDTNLHMNNAYYIEPALLAAGEKEYNYIRMEFKTSAVMNDEIFVNRHRDDENERMVVTLDNAQGESFCVVEFKENA